MIKLKEYKFVKLVSKYSYTIYLVHGPIVVWLWKNPIVDNYVLSTFMNVFVVFLISFVIAYLLSRVPFLNKYIGV